MQSSKFKFVYTNWLNLSFGKYPVANGMHPRVIEWMQSIGSTKEIEKPRNTYDRINEFDQDFQYKDSGIVYRHMSLYQYFKKHYGDTNFVDESQIDPNDSCVYFLPYEIERANIDYFYTTFNFKINDESFLHQYENTLSPRMVEFLRVGKVKVLFGSITEPSCNQANSYSFDTLKNIEKKFTSLGIPPEHIISLWGNTNDSYTGILQFTAHGSLQQQAEIAQRYPIIASSLGYYCDYVKKEDLNISVLRPKKFMSWNRSINRGHRLGIAHLVLKYNLFDDGIFSFLSLPPENERWKLLDELAELIDEPRQNLGPIVNKILEIIPLEVDTQILASWAKDGFQTNENNKKEFYQDAYLHITSETSFKIHHSPFLSEKTFRPMLNLQPFLYFGNYKGLEEIRNLGFKTFPDYIDESYDLEEDPKRRFALLEKEWQRFMKMSKQELHNWYYSTTDILLHNQQHLLSLKDFNPLENLFNKY